MTYDEWKARDTSLEEGVDDTTYCECCGEPLAPEDANELDVDGSIEMACDACVARFGGEVAP